RCFLLVITGEGELGLFISARNGGLYVLGSGGASNKFFLPIGVAVLVPSAIDIIGIFGIFRYAIVGKSFAPHCKILLGVQKFHFSGDIGDARTAADGE